MKGLVSVIFFVLVAAHTVQAEVGDRHTEQAGSFSMRAPKGWPFREFPGMKYQITHGPPANSFSPNINIVDEAYSGSLRTYVDVNLNNIRRIFESFTLVKREAFTTASGLKGEKLVTTSIQQRKLLRQTFYFLPGTKGKYFVVTCSAPAEGGESFDPVFEESVKTFETLK